jgi:ParB family transcriptional regulator, chromosome partitioning protein
MTTTQTHQQQGPEKESPSGAALLRLDPHLLVAHPNNPRKKLVGIKELAASIKLVGVVQPLVVTEDDQGYRIIAGHRRAAAAIEAGVAAVPCVLDASWSESELAPLTAFIAENVNREGLSTSEEAEAYRQLQLLGMPAGDIAKAAGRKKHDVEQAISVAENEVAMALTARHDLTFEQAAGIAEFSEDKEAVKELTVLAVRSPGSFDHKLSRLRQDREREVQHQQLLADYTARGVNVIKRPDRDDKVVVRVSDLYDLKGKALDPKAHEECLGHAVAIETEWSGELHVIEYCTRWKENGHQLKARVAASAASDADAAEANAKRREVIENNKAWRAAEPVRRQFVTDLLARKSTPKGALRYAVDAALSDPSGFGRVDAAQIAVLGSLDLSKGDQWGPAVGHLLVERASDARLPLVLLAQVAASVESSMGVHTWRNAKYAKRERTYLSFLASQGYTLSEIERQVVDADAESKVRHIRSRGKGAAAGVVDTAELEVADDEQSDGEYPDDVA